VNVIARIKALFHRDVDSIVGAFNKAVVQLKAAAARHESASDRHRIAGYAALEASQAAAAEAARANGIVRRIEALIGL
jgi:hypothetical protein